MIRYRNEDANWCKRNMYTDNNGYCKLEIADIDAFDFGPAVLHNYPCPIHYGDSKTPAQPAVLDMERGVFNPSRKAQSEGWRLIRLPEPGWRRSLVVWVLTTFCVRK